MSYHFIDRRLNPKGKSLGNRQRFLRRARAQIREAVQKSLKDRSVSDFAKGQRISIPSKSTAEPRFRHARSGGERDWVLPGNKEFVPGDEIKKPRQGQGGSGQGRRRLRRGRRRFQFTLTQDEILDIFFEDLELPNLVKTDLKEVTAFAYRRAGITTAGTPNNINLVRTMRNSFGRRLALKRPRDEGFHRCSRNVCSSWNRRPSRRRDEIEERKRILAELEALDKRRKWVPYIDPIDVRYNAFEPQPDPDQPGGDVLPDGRFGLDGRAREGSRQALLSFCCTCS